MKLSAINGRGLGYVCSSCRKAADKVSNKQTASLNRPESSSYQWISSRTYKTSSPRRAERRSTNDLIPSSPVRARFAPSPTGYLHLGSLRTALFNYLLAKATGGQFILRVEDTDQKRLVADAEARLCDDLRWAGLQWDEGPQVGGSHSPYRQSERTSLYQRHAADLLGSKAAYRCFCSSNTSVTGEVDASLVGANLSGCQQDCQSISQGQSDQRAQQGDRFVVRFGKPAKLPKWKDLIYGKMSLEVSKQTLPQRSPVENVVLLKSDGTPTYHLANVVDDHAMEITHVIRGTEWMPSTALHVALYDAFGWSPPQFAHVGLLTDQDQNKLSKRNFDTDIRALREKNGILPEALVNFLALLGWRNPQKNDVMGLQELANIFDLKFTRGNTIVSLDKLWYLQRHHAKRRIDSCMNSSGPPSPFDELHGFVLAEVERSITSDNLGPILAGRSIAAYVKAVLLIDRGSYENPKSYIERNHYFFAATASSESSVDVSPFADKAELFKVVSEFIHDPTVRDALGLWAKLGAAEPKTLWDELSRVATHCNSMLEAACFEKARTILYAGNTGSGQSVDVKKSKEYRGLVKALHLYMRNRLAGDAPGPSTGSVLAVLGYDESLRRLQVADGK